MIFYPPALSEGGKNIGFLVAKPLLRNAIVSEAPLHSESRNFATKRVPKQELGNENTKIYEY
jgi:hypothetical protein